MHLLVQFFLFLIPLLIIVSNDRFINCISNDTFCPDIIDRTIYPAQQCRPHGDYYICSSIPSPQIDTIYLQQDLTTLEAVFSTSPSIESSSYISKNDLA